AALAALRLDDEVDAALCRALQARIGSQTVGLAHGDGGQAVRVHAPAEVALTGLLAHQVAQRALDILGVEGALVAGAVVRLAGAEERKQAESRAGVVFAHAVAGAIAMPVLIEAVEGVMPVWRLVAGKPFQAGGHGCLGQVVAATLADHLLARGATAAA